MTSIPQRTRSAPVVKTITRTCTASIYTQACYHYYSVLENYDWVKNDVFTCTDNYIHDRPKKNLLATGIWKKQHELNLWRSYTKPSYTFRGDVRPPACDRDEWPAIYFFENGKHPHDLEKQQGQLIRYLPAAEISGAASNIWTGFCNKRDGGEGNAQYIKKAKASKSEVNHELVELQQPGETIKNTQGLKTTTTTLYEAKFTRAVFEMDFDWTGVNKPSRENDWRLRENPCWPEDIVPDNPGYVLLRRRRMRRRKRATWSLSTASRCPTSPPRTPTACRRRPHRAW